MFDELLRELQRLEGSHQISITVPSDAEGYFDRECPSPECLFSFKIHQDDWRNKVRDEEVFCPFCRHAANSDAWWTQEQLRRAQQEAQTYVSRRVTGALRRDAHHWNRRQPRDSFLRITMRVDNTPSHVSLPWAVAAAMQLKITCPACTCRYAVIGAAFFCPACGHNAADLMFNQSITGIRNAIDALPQVREAIPDQDTAETTIRSLIESGLQNAVTAFQRYAEALYTGIDPTLPTPRRNAFQNLTDGSNLWHQATGKRYADHIKPEELATLERSFQQRHLLAHTQGIVDTDYITKTGDASYRVGQRIVIRESTVRETLILMEKLTARMISDTTKKESAS